MKLRIRGATLRLRLTRGEVDQLAAGQSILESTPFPDGSTFSYSLNPAADLNARQVSGATGTQLEIEVPAARAQVWAESDEVGFTGDAAVRIGELDVLIEKDFTCITPRDGEEELDTFPNPNAA